MYMPRASWLPLPMCSTISSARRCAVWTCSKTVERGTRVQAPILVGAVVYDPKVVVIWDIIKDFFENQGYPIDYVFYSNYELQVDALLAGHIHIAWNSPL